MLFNFGNFFVEIFVELFGQFGIIVELVDNNF